MKLLRPLTGWLLLLAMAASLAAQTPQQIRVIKSDRYRQTAAATRDALGSDINVTVSFAPTPAATTTVQLRSPAGTTATLDRDATGQYAMVRSFASATDLEASWPDGTYAVTVDGGSPTTLNVALLTGAAVATVLISNYDALQAWPDASPQIRWGSIPPSTSGTDSTSLTVLGPDGQTVYATPPSLSFPFATAANVPAFLPLTGHLVFSRTSVAVVNNGLTTVTAGHGFDLAFPLTSKPPAPAAPAIQFQPVSKIASPGDQVQFSVVYTGGSPLSVQWKKDGVAVPGATGSPLQFSSVQVANAGTYTVEISNSSGTIVSTPALLGVRSVYNFTPYAGVIGQPGAADGPAGIGKLSFPGPVAVDRAGAIYVGDGTCIRKVAPDGSIITLAGLNGATGSADGAGSDARFSSPWGLAFDAAGNLYVADLQNSNVRKITPDGRVTTLAGTAGARGYVDATGTAARFSGPTGVAVNAAGDVYVSDVGNYLIRKITPDGTVTTVAGTPGQSGLVDGPAASARFGAPEGLAFDRSGTLYIGDDANYAVRTLSPGGQVGTFVAANPGNLRLSSVAVDDAGNVYVAGGGFGRFSPEGVGSAGGVPSLGNPAQLPSFYFLPNFVAVRSDGTVLVSDGPNGALELGTLAPGSRDAGIAIAASPLSTAVAPGASLALRVAATGPDLVYQWRKNGSAVRGATASTLYVDHVSATDAATYTAVVANGLGIASTSAPAVINLGTDASGARLSNLSILARAGAGPQTLTVGAVIGGAANGPGRTMLVRAIGPALRGFGVNDVLADPILSVVNNGQVVASNDNWGSAPDLAQTFSAVGAFALTAGSLDAALLRAFAPGPYSVQVTTAGSGTGLALAEIYDASTGGDSAAARLVNLSARCQVGTGADVLTAGFYISGATGKTLLIRGVGPSLTSFGITGALADPQLTIYTGNRMVASNDDWDFASHVQPVGTIVGAFSLSSTHDAALLITLPPGSYTAQVSGAGGGTGVALVEIYEAP